MTVFVLGTDDKGRLGVTSVEVGSDTDLQFVAALAAHKGDTAVWPTGHLLPLTYDERGI